MASTSDKPTGPSPTSLALEQPTNTANRIGQACLACRRKKIKCDGQDSCHNCSSRDLECKYPGSNDNASTSRRYAQSFEDRCRELDKFCHRLESLSSQLSQSIESIQILKGGFSAGNELTAHSEELQQAARTLQSLPVHTYGENLINDKQSNPTPGDDHASNLDFLAEAMENTAEDELEPEEEIDSDDIDFPNDLADTNDPGGKFGSLVADSYGRLRYLGGAANNVLVEAVKGLSPDARSSLYVPSPGSSIVADGSVNLQHNIQPDLEMPMFVRGQRWPEMPYFPRPEEITRPPQYVADLLVNLYFDQLHYTFPVLYKPHFMSQYKQMISPRATNPADKGFLSVFFAVCACASSLLPSDGKSTGFAGLAYYQKSLVLHYASTGEASLDRVQCLALLAMCSGGWNTLTQSWNFAGQAVRAAQDLGMHLSSLTTTSNDPSEIVKQQLSRRIWWVIYCLDRVTSMCLGRPMAADDADCYCELPRNVGDDDLEAYLRDGGKTELAFSESTTSPMIGFLSFIRLCRIGGKIQKLHSPLRMRKFRDPRRAKQLLRSVASIQKSLDRWLASLPDEIRFSANTVEHGSNLTMCVIMFIVHAGLLLSLYQVLSSLASQVSLGSHWNEAVSHCISAAQSCINAAELIQQLVPPSHHLALCVYYLTLSGIVLLRLPDHPKDKTLPDVEKCIKFLKSLETTWSGARKGRAIIEHLMSRMWDSADPGPSQSFMDDQNFLWDQIVGSETFTFEGVL